MPSGQRDPQLSETLQMSEKITASLSQVLGTLKSLTSWETTTLGVIFPHISKQADNGGKGEWCSIGEKSFISFACKMLSTSIHV